MVKRDAIRLEFGNGFQRRGKACHGLLRQTVHQVDVDRAKTRASRVSDHPLDRLQAMDTINRFLYFRIQFLDTDTDPIETQVAQMRRSAGLHYPRIDLDRVIAFAALTKLEMPRYLVHQLLRLLPRQETWRATTPVQQAYLAIPIE